MTCAVYILGKTKGEMLPTNLENIEGRQLTEQELDALYLYLDMYMDGMGDDEKLFWLQILSKVDKEFYDNTSSGTEGLHDVQNPEKGS